MKMNGKVAYSKNGSIQALANAVGIKNSGIAMKIAKWVSIVNPQLETMQSGINLLRKTYTELKKAIDNKDITDKEKDVENQIVLEKSESECLLLLEKSVINFGKPLNIAWEEFEDCNFTPIVIAELIEFGVIK